MKKRTRGRDFFSQPGSVTTWASPLPASRIAAIFAGSTGMVGWLLELEVEVEKDSLYDFLAIGEKLKLKGLAKTPEHSASQVIISFSLFVHVASNYHPYH